MWEQNRHTTPKARSSCDGRPRTVSGHEIAGGFADCSNPLIWKQNPHQVA
jgi:hypothetical protein